MKILLFLLSFFLIISNKVWSQTDTTVDRTRHSAVYSAEVAGLGATGPRTPFWLRANQFGIIPANSPAGIAIVSANHTYKFSPYRSRQLSYGVEVVGQAGRASRVVLPQAYVSLDLGRFSLWGGRRKEIIGLGDSTLTSGFYAWSGNALPITKVQFGTNGFAPLGFTRNLIWVHGFFAHGWFANSDSLQGAYLHQKALYVRLGKPGWRVRFTGGVLHNAQWGGRSTFVPSLKATNWQLPDSFSDYLYVLTAREGGPPDSPNLTDHDRVNRIGNHLGSIDFGIEADLGRWQAMGYYQHPFEDKSGVAFQNMPDGLYGLRLQRQSDAGFRIDHILVEYLNTMSQSGSLIGVSRYDGKDDYFNNFQYLDGWAHDRNVIGTPFLSRRADIRADLPYGPERRIWAIANNQVQLYHLAVAGTAGQSRNGQLVRWQIKLSASQNHGAPRLGFQQPIGQFSGLASVVWPLNWLGGSELRTSLALDQGQLLTNAVGGWLSLRKTWKTKR
ncbi:capsule assembly Wzi family protein [Spirosoma montaniterrae]|uniref:Capsule assembly Wzi family protein n=1 Tax=Spirosoma montaniterrae TaxID=1178516 RepID=A0A1P9X182_9BACT|nr:capsule assembly Wzi family protein [Spirosoma montaniterrae]AQG81391.1 hypothetical protein AWR27_19940 [Spirosoma montaniterrae]